MRFSMRVSFFDMELGVFLGETWRLPGKGMNVRDEYESSESGNGKGDNGEDDDEHVDCEQFVRDVKLNGRLLTVDFAEEMVL